MIKNMPILQTLSISVILLFSFYVKYFLQGWSGGEIDSTEKISYAIIVLGFVMGMVALLISSNRERVCFFIILAFFGMNFIFSQNKSLFWAVSAFPFFIYLSRLTIDKISLVFLISILMAWLFFIPVLSFNSVGMFFQDDRYVRLTFGFSNPNTFSALLFVTYSLLLLYIDARFKVYGISFILYLLVSMFIFPLLYTSMSRTFIFSAVLLFLYFPLRRIPFLKIKPWHAKLLMLSICSFQLFLTFTYSRTNEWLFILNTIFSGRIRLSNEMFHGLGLPELLIGRDISEYMPIDLFFPNLLFSSGWLFFFIFLFFYFKILSGMQFLSNLASFVCFSFILLSLTENLFNIPVVNFTMFILYCALLHFKRVRAVKC